MSDTPDIKPGRRTAIRIMAATAWAALVAVAGLGLGAVMRLVGASSGPSRPSSVEFGPAPERGMGMLAKRDGLALMRDEGGLYALDLTCPHLGCRPEWREGDRHFHCPCHGSLFTADGALVRGPAKRGLDHAALEMDSAGRLVAHVTRKAPPTTRLRKG